MCDMGDIVKDIAKEGVKGVADVTKETVKAIAKDVYTDLGHPVAQPSGELVSLVPRAIKAALAPLEKWVLQQEYNVAETKKLLEEKLKNVSPELIEAPEAHIAVPALQYISYCMDNDELRDMYANLLANSMNSVVKNGVHPGFIEIIKQLSPDEAKILKIFLTRKSIPTVTFRYEKDDGSGINIIRNFSNVGETVGCEHPYDTNKYFDNLIRLGLLESASALSSLTDKSLYEPLKKHSFFLPYMNPGEIQRNGFSKTNFIESFVSITDYGRSFCAICLGTIKTSTTTQNI